MITFQQAREIVKERWPGYVVAGFGFETDDEWFLTLLPERTGGRVPAVNKESGALRWIEAYGDEYNKNRPVGVRR